MSKGNEKQRRGEFDDALKGYYQDHDEVLPEENVDFRTLTAESVGSLVLGFLSLLTFISILFVVFPVMGIVLGITAIRKILRAEKELAGMGVASAGVFLSVLFMIAGLCYLSYIWQYEIPPGYQYLDFSMLVAESATGRIPESVLNLTPHRDAQGNEIAGTPVFIEGYMFPTRQMTDIKRFMLVPSLAQNKFGAVTRNPTEMIEVSLWGDAGVSYQTKPVKVGGILYVNPNPKAGDTPYRLEADVFR
ncbi:MAG: DUF4190 domain-containing protein [Planctomycetaceae bacterium]|jgi:hypothetical protein|nr:DUF4190 domain-containing protein [Planctomycetaceae bacterium]